MTNMLKQIVSVLLLCFSTFSLASDYPNKSIRWVVPYAAGGTADIIARLVSQPLSEILGQQIIVENRPGAGNNIGTEAVIKSAPDGYTMLFVNPANAINTTLYKNLSFDFVRDISPVVGLIRTPNIVVVPISSPANSINDFINYCKSNNGKLTMASSGVGTSPHLAGELFQSMTGCKMVHVPYKGAGPATTDLIAGHVQIMFDNLPSSITHVRSGKLKPLAITSQSREPLLPSLPSVREFLSGYDVTAWYGIGMPKDTPKEIINRMNIAVNKAMKDPKLKERLQELGGYPINGTPDDFSKVIISETQKWSKVVKDSGAVAE